MNTKFFCQTLTALLISMLMASCQPMETVTPNTEDEEITLSFASEGTKLEYTEGLAQLVWSDNDQIGIYGVNGAEYPNKSYTISAGVGQSTGKFENPEVRWKANTENNPHPYTFYGYYPFSENAYSASVGSLAHEKVHVSMPHTQAQAKSNDSSHMGIYRIMATKSGARTISQETSSIGGFTFDLVVPIFQFVHHYSLPAGVTITSITIECLEEGNDYFTFDDATLNIPAFCNNKEEGYFTVNQGSKSATVNINGGLKYGESAFLMVAPGMDRKKIQIRFTTSDGKTYIRTKNGATEYTSKTGGYKGNVRYLFDIQDATELEEEPETLPVANCYMVAPDPTREYRFDVNFKGDEASEANRLANGVKIGILETQGLQWEANFEASHFKYNKETGVVTFTPTSHDSGSALLALYDASGKILWTWHIWFTEDITEVSANGAIFMDRNLGSVSTTDEGKCYNWGRKDPISNTGNIVHPHANSPKKVDQWQWSVEHPLVFIDNWTSGDWGATKTINDPCPYGWRVPTKEEMQPVMDNYEWDTTQGWYSNQTVGIKYDGLKLPYGTEREGGKAYWVASLYNATHPYAFAFDNRWEYTGNRYNNGEPFWQTGLDQAYSRNIRCIKDVVAE